VIYNMRTNELQLHKIGFELNGQHAKYVIKLVDLLSVSEPYDNYDPIQESSDVMYENYRRLVEIKKLLDEVDIY
jgi:hypothetical protein